MESHFVAPQRSTLRHALLVLGLAGLMTSVSCGGGSRVKELPPAPADDASESSAGTRARITLEDTVGRGTRHSFSGSLESWSWADDGRTLVRGRGEDAVAIDPQTLAVTTSGEPEDAREDSPSFDAAAALATLDGIDEDRARRLARRPAARSSDGGIQVFLDAGRILVARADGSAGVLVEAGASAPELLDLAPDGSRLGFVRDRDLHVVSTTNGELRAVTNDASEDQYDGILDWVYQEEVYGRGDFKGFWWSPASTHVAFLSLDESGVHEFTVVDHVENGHFRVTPEITHYPKAGDPNPVTKLGLYDARDGSLSWFDLAEYGESEPLVVRVGWTPDGAHLLYTVQNRIQTWAELVTYDLDAGERDVWIREESEAWVNRPRSPRWLSDGSFLWESERTGYRHLYHYGADGTLLSTLTRGEWEVRSVLRVDEERREVWFTGSRDGAIDENVYRAPFDGSELVRLTSGPGSHRVDPNGDGSLFLDRVSSRTRPPEVRLCDGRTGEVLHVLATSEPAPADAPRLARWELHEVPARDGFPLDVAVLKPLDFDPDAVYPVWLSTYSGPNAATIRNSWRPSSWNQFLAQEGVIVLNVNVRTASRKGHAVIAECYEQFLVQELLDIEDAVDWLTANPWADAERVGITGWSYGGSMTAYALTNSDRFALGIAGAGVYDWRMYDTIYTERYMNTPKANPEGYERSSVLASAANLDGHLILVHGTKDDNVHLQNTIQLVHALQKAGHEGFELMLYAESRHGVGDGDLRWHMRRQEWGAIQDHLRP